MAALKAGPTVHIDESTTVSHGTISFSDDATASGGQQDITLSAGGYVEIRYVAGVGYVRGDVPGLVGFMGVAQAQAQSLANRWISVRPGQQVGGSPYSDIVDGITLSSLTSQIGLTAPLTVTAPATVAGQRVIGVHGDVPASDQLPAGATATLDVAATGSRPVLWTSTAGSNIQSTLSFSNWGKPVRVAAPEGSIPAPAAAAPTPTPQQPALQ
jgi:hypothetical protein